MHVLQYLYMQGFYVYREPHNGYRIEFWGITYPKKRVYLLGKGLIFRGMPILLSIRSHRSFCRYTLPPRTLHTAQYFGRRCLSCCRATHELRVKQATLHALLPQELEAALLLSNHRRRVDKAELRSRIIGEAAAAAAARPPPPSASPLSHHARRRPSCQRRSGSGARR